MNKPSDRAGLRNYQLLCGFALGVIFLLQLQPPSPNLSFRYRDFPMYTNLLMLLVGIVSILGSREIGPTGTLLFFGITQAFLRHQIGSIGQQRDEFLNPLDLTLSLTMLGFVISLLRYNALRYRPIPIDPRRPGARIALTVGMTEIVGLLIGLPAFTLASQGVWMLIVHQEPILNLPTPLQRFLILVWVFGIGALVAGFLLSTWKRRTMDKTSAHILLQDVLWSETRGEQRRLERWLAWTKVRQAEHEEG